MYARIGETESKDVLREGQMKGDLIEKFRRKLVHAEITSAWEISFAAASALLARSPSLSFETRTSLGAVHYRHFMSDSTFPHSPLICVKNGSSISIQARAYERYAPSLQGQGVRHPLRPILHRRRRSHRKDGA